MCRATACWRIFASWGITSVEAVQSARVFLIEADFDQDFAERVGARAAGRPGLRGVLHRPERGPPAGLAKATLIEVHLKSGVTDPVAESVMAAIADMGAGSRRRADGPQVRPAGRRSKPSQIETIARKILANDCIEDVVDRRLRPSRPVRT